MKQLLFAIVTSLTASLVWAQSSTSYDLEEVYIQADQLKIPFSAQNRNIIILKRQELEKLPVKSVNELLGYIAGVDVRQRGPNGTQADIGMDGGSFDQVLVMLNGIKMSDPQTGHNMMNLPVALDAIERIEIMKGAAARIYGINSLMGVINIVTKDPQQTGIQASVYGGSNFQKDDSTAETYANFGAQAVASFGNAQAGNQLSLGYDKGNGYRYNTAYENTKIMYHGAFTLNPKARLNVLGGYVNNDFGANQFYAAPNDKEAVENMQVAIAGINATLQASDKWTIMPSVNYRYGKDDYIYVRQNPGLYHNIHETHSVDVSLNNTLLLGKGTLLLGLNYRMEKINSNNLGKDERNHFGLFAGYRYLVHKDVDVNAGAYVNYNEQFGLKVYPGLDIGWTPAQSWRLYANVGTGQRLPTYTDLYYSGPNNIGNPDLVPEWATTAELGTRYQHQGLSFQLSGFYRNGTNFIDWVKADSTAAWRTENFAAVNTFGWNLNGSYNWELSQQLHLLIHLGYTYLYPEISGSQMEGNTGLISKYTINSLHHQLVGRVHAQLGKHWHITLTNRLVKRWHTEHVGSYKAKAYHILDCRLAYHFSGFTLYADVTNFGDVQYIESGVVPLPGRWATLGLRYALWK